MNVILSIQNYVDKMVEEAGPGMKILLMDRETVSFSTTICSVFIDFLPTDLYHLDGNQSNGNAAQRGVSV